ncbi:Crm2 family CRISPR-associated protein [Rivularia sp. IAM M-261]|nr:Crm2 family CRISPR-associated protein [Rivularia sp. IAM M-261]
MKFYQRKLYALLQVPELRNWNNSVTSQLQCLKIDTNLDELETWWRQVGKQAQDISSSSDHLNLEALQNSENLTTVIACHPISGQKQLVTALHAENQPDIGWIQQEEDAEKVFWWFWRFYPELLADAQHDALLFPSHTVLSDCPLHSHQSAVSALTGTMFPENWECGKAAQTPYLLVFTFSPVQDFIKSSRKFLDFWAGSYLLHYLSTKLCLEIAEKLGPDAVIIPSLWSQEIIDSLIIKKYPEFASYFECLQEGKNPVTRFDDKISTSLSTAGFPNAITVLVPGREAAQDWGKFLSQKLTEEWAQIGEKVRKHIRREVTYFLRKQNNEKLKSIIKEVFPELKDDSPEFDKYYKELEYLGDEKKHGCWEWKSLWEVQLNHTWEPYWTAVPLGNPNSKPEFAIQRNDGAFDEAWLEGQDAVAQPLVHFPNEFEKIFYTDLNVGSWWGSIQQRLRLCLNDVKYTRNWQVATAPGERSTISGQFSAVHPRFNYTKKDTSEGKVTDLREGAGVPVGSMRLFWHVMSKAYPGLFNGSEKLNALELTKRMAWVYGGVAEALGVPIDLSQEGKLSKIIDYEQLIRFPNLSSIGAAAFARDNPQLLRTYRDNLYSLFRPHRSKFSDEKKRAFYNKTSRPFHIQNSDAAIKEKCSDLKRALNGVMLSSKWLIDDMGLQGKLVIKDSQNSQTQVEILRDIVQQAHKNTGFGDSSPADWWVILLADGDGMGDYVSGKKLKQYKSYVEVEGHNRTIPGLNEFLNNTDKRMGPATHVGLNRALLDFSNRLVPYLTEKRFCGRVIYSGGDDVMVVLPLEDLPEYLLSLRAAWSGEKDPKNEFENKHNGADNQTGDKTTGYWYPSEQVKGLPKRPHFTMGEAATMSAGIVIAHKSVPLPTVLKSLWEAEGDRAKKITKKDGLCFRVIYGGGNQLEALMKGKLLAEWWDWVKEYKQYKENLAPLLYRLAEELPRRASVTKNSRLFAKVARVIMNSRDNINQDINGVFDKIEGWLDNWENWVKEVWVQGVIENWAKNKNNNSKEYSIIFPIIKEVIVNWAKKYLQDCDKKILEQWIETAIASANNYEFDAKNKQTLEEWIEIEIANVNNREVGSEDKQILEGWIQAVEKNNNSQPFDGKLMHTIQSAWIRQVKESEFNAVGTKPEDLAKILRFTAFWVDKRVERQKWANL